MISPRCQWRTKPWPQAAHIPMAKIAVYLKLSRYASELRGKQTDIGILITIFCTTPRHVGLSYRLQRVIEVCQNNILIPISSLSHHLFPVPIPSHSSNQTVSIIRDSFIPTLIDNKTVHAQHLLDNCTESRKLLDLFSGQNSTKSTSRVTFMFATGYDHNGRPV